MTLKMMYPVESDIPHIKPATLCQLVTDTEEQQWRQTEIRDTVADADIEPEDLGQTLLKHGTSVKKINSYFMNLESRRFCMLLAGRKSTFTNVALVGEGHDEEIVTNSKLKEEYKVHHLDSKDFQVFQHAYLCATFPVLGAPDPPSPFTPSPVESNDSDTKRFSFNKIPQSRTATPYSLQDSGVEDQDETAVIPTETLCELIRRSFHLSPSQYNQYEKIIVSNFKKRSAQKLLAEELCKQLSFVENNTNPFYNPHTFMTRNGYDIWQHNERAQVSELLDKFWHFSLPFPSGSDTDGSKKHSFHHDYCILLNKLLKYESQSKMDCSEIDKPLYGLLSSASLRLLREFGLRYGIGEQYRRIVYIKYLTEKLSFNVWYLHHIVTVLSTIYEVLPHNRGTLVMVREEYLMLDESVQSIIVQTSKALTQMKNLFPNNQPPEGVELLLDLLSIAQDIKSYLTLEKKPVMKHYLHSLLKDIFKPAYEQHKMVAQAELGRENSLCPKLLNILINNIRDEILDYKTNFQQIFDRFFDISELAAQSFYSLLMQDIENVLDFEKKNKPMDISLLMLGLAYRLNQFDQDFSQYILPQYQVWRSYYEGEVVQWAVAFRVQLQNLVLMSVENDQFKGKEICLEGPLSQPTSRTVSRRSFNFSLKSLTPSVNSAFSSIHSSVISTPKHVHEHIIKTKSSTIIEQSPEQIPNGFPEPQFNFDTQSLNVPETTTRYIGGIRTSNSLPDIIRTTTERQPQSSLDITCQSVHSLDIQDDPTLFSTHSDSNRTPTAGLQGNGDEGQVQGHSQGQGYNYDSDTDEEIGEVMKNFHESVDEADSVSPVSEKVAYSFPQISTIKVAKSSRTADSLNRMRQNSLPSTTAPSIGVPQSSGFLSKMYTAFFNKSGSNSLQTSRDDLTSDVGNSTLQSDFMDSLVSDLSTVTMPDFPNSNVLLPVSGSAIDMMVLLQRNIYFVQMLCDIIYPSIQSEELPGVSCDTIIRLEFQQFTAKQDVYSRFLKTIRETICMYVDNMLSLDLCGSSLSLSKKILGPQLIEYIQTQQISGLLWGCRHQLKPQTDCLQYANKQTSYLCDRYEPITQQMCSRVNNVYLLSKLLEHYEQQLLLSINLTHGEEDYVGIEDDVDSNTGRESAVSDSSNYSMIESLFDGDNEDDEIKNYCRKTAINKPSLSFIQTHIMSVLRGMVKLLSYRLNLFLKDAIPLLLELKSTKESVGKCLRPIIDFLTNYFTSLSQWLYKDCYLMLHENLWIFIVQDFELEVDKLKKEERGVQTKAQNLIQAITYLLKFMNNNDNGISKKLLLSQAEDVLFQLQLFTLTTKQLVSLYLTLTKQNEPHLITVDPAMTTLLYKLCEDLETKNKCFNGHILVSWLMYHKHLVHKIDPSYKLGPFYREKAVEFCQKLLNLHILVDIDASSPADRNQCTTPSLDGVPIHYPGITVYSQYYHDAYTSSEEEITPTGSPRPHNNSNTPRVTPKSAQQDISRDSPNPGNVENFVEVEVEVNTVQSMTQIPQIVCDSEHCGDVLDSDPVVQNENDRATKLDDRDKLGPKNSNCDMEIGQNDQNDLECVEPQVFENVNNQNDSSDHIQGPNSELTYRDMLKSRYMTDRDSVGSGLNLTSSRDSLTSREDLDSSISSEKYQPITDEYYEEVVNRSIDSRLDKDSIQGDENQHSNRKQTIKLPLFSQKAQIDSSRTSSLSTASSRFLPFHDSKMHFYYIDEAYIYGNQNFTPKADKCNEHVYNSETLRLAEKCFQKKISPLYLLVIMYGRRKYDVIAKSVIYQLSKSVIQEIKDYIDIPSNTCISS
ncbi:hypothetical protein LOTGIDRAFT_231644 [Lottia gigantea]|uniref:MHD2 domain-containing protein n=1 Tax=Lottia gigantea TaxID=225164 RepID=V4C5D4_LOTGI|nr:hypothetical protein LOTGIDRAFT_231644 [Lottia gigantea]ESO96804.1 hypothetical protein LOTGIDRAFT_231644 [Lottia gigantea]